MSKISSGLFRETAGARAWTLRSASHAILDGHKDAQGDKPKMVSPYEIRFSQSSVNGSEKIIKSMKKNGWIGDPIDVVIMDDGKMTTLDNTRVVAARAAGIDVKANIHRYDESLPNQETKDRFRTPKGGEPQTWGQAVENRIGKQTSNFKRNNPRGSYNMDKIN